MRKKLVLLMILAAALMALPALAQNFGKPYKPKYDQAQKQQVVATTTAPSATFQSTSTMSGSGSSYSANPTLSGNGTATYNGASAPSSGPHRAKKNNEGGEFEEEDLGDDPNGPGNPIGDALLPLLFMSLAFCGYLYLRRKRSEA